MSKIKTNVRTTKNVIGILLEYFMNICSITLMSGSSTIVRNEKTTNKQNKQQKQTNKTQTTQTKHKQTQQTKANNTNKHNKQKQTNKQQRQHVWTSPTLSGECNSSIFVEQVKIDNDLIVVYLVARKTLCSPNNTTNKQKKHNNINSKHKTKTKTKTTQTTLSFNQQ